MGLQIATAMLSNIAVACLPSGSGPDTYYAIPSPVRRMETQSKVLDIGKFELALLWSPGGDVLAVTVLSQILEPKSFLECLISCWGPLLQLRWR